MSNRYGKYNRRRAEAPTTPPRYDEKERDHRYSRKRDEVQTPPLIPALDFSSIQSNDSSSPPCLKRDAAIYKQKNDRENRRNCESDKRERRQADIPRHDSLKLERRQHRSERNSLSKHNAPRELEPIRGNKRVQRDAAAFRDDILSLTDKQIRHHNKKLPSLSMSGGANLAAIHDDRYNRSNLDRGLPSMPTAHKRGQLQPLGGSGEVGVAYRNQRGGQGSTRLW